MNIRVPEQISIMGFDNIHEAKVISPELTTIHVKKDILPNGCKLAYGEA